LFVTWLEDTTRGEQDKVAEWSRMSEGKLPFCRPVMIRLASPVCPATPWRISSLFLVFFTAAKYCHFTHKRKWTLVKHG